MITFVPTPPSSSPLSAIQGDIAYGDGNDATTTVITYSLAQYADTQAWTTGYREEFRAALAVIESVANIDFVEVSLASNPDLVEVLAPSSWFSSPNTLGFHYTPSNSTSFGAYNTDYWIEGVNGAPGGYFFTTILHELGHALGLGHPHDDGLGTTVLQGVTSEFDSFGNAGLNQGVFTVMSYNDGWTSQNGILPVSSTYGGSTGLGALDIAALQALYGANTTTNSAGNTYFLPSSNTAGTGYESIWDTGGIDTIQSDSSSSTIIDLREATLTYSNGGGGYVSYVNGVEGGFTIANGVVIENATGGSGNDTLIGNTAENVLNGRGGNDVIRSRSDGSNDNTINGGSGNDTIYLANGSGADTVNGNEGNDRAIVTNNTGSFAGGVGTDTVVFVKGLKNYLVETNGSNYEFFNVITRDTFTVANDVEVFQFANGSQSFNSSNLTSATQIRNIETTGTVLQHADHGVYVLGGSTAKIALTRNGIIIGEDSLNGWTAIHTEADSSGYRLLWQHNDGRYLEWDINDQGAWQSGALVDNVVDVEVFYGVDFNNDGTIGHTITAVENAGSTTLSSSTQGVYLIDGSTQLTRNGDLVGPDSLNGWTALHAEADSSGYRLLWQHSDGRYLEWDINDQGAWQDGALVDNVVDVESFYGVDFNNDGTIGHTITAVENTGSATLSSSTQGVYLIDGSTQLTRNGELIGENSLNGWTALHVETDSSGYRLLWQHNDGRYLEWDVNDQGTWQGGKLVGNVVDVEAFYGVDFNNDGTIGHTITAVENTGSTSLSSSTQGAYVIDGSTLLTRNGELIGEDSLNGWTALHVEADSSGYRLLWQHSDGRYLEWDVNDQGAWQSGKLVGNVVDVEAFYGVDFDNDGTIGHTITAVENTGSTSLSSSTQGVYLIDGSTQLTRNGELIGENSLNGWTALHVETDSSGYRLLWQHSDGRYLEWDVNDQGAWQSGKLVGNVVDVEAFYGVDFDNDGTIGHTITAVENTGSTSLSSSTQGVYVIDGSTLLTRKGELIGEDSLNGWTALHVETDSSGYRLLWQHSDGRYLEWDINDQGAWQSGKLVGNVVDVEAFYGVDFDNDGTIGHTITAVENAGSTSLSSSTQGVYLIDGSIQLTRNGELIGEDSLNGWTALHVEADSSGYRLLWQHSDGRYLEWDVNDQGAWQSGKLVDDVVEVEAFYVYDIDGSGTVGFELPRLVQPSEVKPAREPAPSVALELNAQNNDAEFVFVDYVPEMGAHRTDLEIGAFLDFDEIEDVYAGITSRDEDQSITEGTEFGIFEDDIFMI